MMLSVKRSNTWLLRCPASLRLRSMMLSIKRSNCSLVVKIQRFAQIAHLLFGLSGAGARVGQHWHRDRVGVRAVRYWIVICILQMVRIYAGIQCQVVRTVLTLFEFSTISVDHVSKSCRIPEPCYGSLLFLLNPQELFPCPPKRSSAKTAAVYFFIRDSNVTSRAG